MNDIQLKPNVKIDFYMESDEKGFISVKDHIVLAYGRGNTVQEALQDWMVNAIAMIHEVMTSNIGIALMSERILRRYFELDRLNAAPSDDAQSTQSEG